MNRELLLFLFIEMLTDVGRIRASASDTSASPSIISICTHRN